MDEPLVLVTRLDDLAAMAATESQYERAAVYAAVTAILAGFSDSKLKSNQQVMELVRAICFYISAAVGYAFIPNKTREQCIAKAQDKLISLRTAINVCYY